MAKNLLEEGYPVIGYNRSRSPIDELIEAGGEGADSVQELASQSDVVFTCLPDSEVVAHILRGDEGIIEALSGGETIINTSTISLIMTKELASELAELGVDMLYAPLSGGETGAIDGSLSIMVGGDTDVFTEHRHLLTVLGETITHCGLIGTRQITKSCNQIVVGNTPRGDNRNTRLRSESRSRFRSRC